MILANQPGEKSWPMTAATWILVYKQPSDAAATAEALKFFAWAYAKGGKMAEELDYVPMPDKVVADIEKTWAVRNQGRGRQAALHALNRAKSQERRRTGAFPSSIRTCAQDGLCRGQLTA